MRRLSIPSLEIMIIAQIAADLFEFKENTRSVLLHMSMFDAEIEQISG